MITDYDGNIYHTVIIGTQEWLIENLRTTHYNDGTAILDLTQDISHGVVTTDQWNAENGTPGHDGAFCWPTNSGDTSDTVKNRGAIYNGYALNNAKGIAPEGFRVPTIADFITLSNYIGNQTISGGKLKSITGWNAPNTGATDEFHFKGGAVEDRRIVLSGQYWQSRSGYYGYFWTSDYGHIILSYNSAALTLITAPRDARTGMVVRCIRDLSFKLIQPKRINIDRSCVGVYLRWYFNGWHYFNFSNGYEVNMKTSNADMQVTKMFSVISKIEHPTRITSEFSYNVVLEGIADHDIPAFINLLLAEKVEQYEDRKWYEVDITRGTHPIKEIGAPGYKLTFEITRKDLANTSSVYQKSQKLYIGDTLADIDDDEIIPINKQTNDIAEMQDRQSDFTAEFKIRKTRIMRALFGLSGEVGSNTTFPYEKQSCKLIQDNIEIITDGYMILNKTDDQFYYVSVYSGNLNFFKELDGKKLTDLTLESCNHTWNIAAQVASHAGDLDYIYPLCEPSNDGGITPPTDNGSRVKIFSGHLWPFIRAKAIWDEIMSATGYTVSGDILTNPRFLNLFMPIVNRNTNQSFNQYLYSAYNDGQVNYTEAKNILRLGTLINGNTAFRYGAYSAPCSGKFTFKTTLHVSYYASAPAAYIRVGTTDTEMHIDVAANILLNTGWEYSLELEVNAGDVVYFIAGPAVVYHHTRSVIKIEPQSIGFLSPVTPAINLPDMSQTEFVKMVCNMFGLIPEAKARDRKIRFWNYIDLYNNIPKARDWSEYLSEREDETEFKFGEYAQNNYLKYKSSDDVRQGTGEGIMMVEDETLQGKKDVLELPVSTCDEVTVMSNVRVSRIGFSEYDKDSGTYQINDSIDPRIVYVNQCDNTKSLSILDNASPANETTINAPYKAVSSEISMAAIVSNYSGLSRMLTKTNLRRAKFNLPVYEVAGLKHDIPIYLRQYKAYFYVNKINNYVPGKLCVIDLIKL